MAEKSWMDELQKEWDLMAREREIKRRRCIYRVPEFMCEVGNPSYTPQAVSLGPYHHGSKLMKGMEKLKRKIIGLYLAKIKKTLGEAAEAMGREARELMDAYDALEEPWMTDAGQFVQLMIVDGCFLLGLLYIFCGLETDEGIRRCYEKDMAPMYHIVKTDIMLLENQVPPRALEIMAELGGEKVPTTNISCLYLRRSPDKSVPNAHAIDIDHPHTTSFAHMLHAVWFSRLITNDFLFKPILERAANPPDVIELVEAGVEIKSSESMTISFEEGTLKLPHITFLDDMVFLYDNLMAFEAMHQLDPEFCSYVDFMECLVNTEEDVDILRRNGVISGGGSSDEDIAEFFNRGPRRTYPPKRIYRTEGVDVAKLLVDYCKNWHSRWIVYFKRLFHQVPWAFVSMFGFIISLLTILSTVYAILDYYYK